MRLHHEILTIRTSGQGLFSIDAEVGRVLHQAGVHAGLCTVFIRHTSASLLIQENADPSARADLEAFLNRLAPESPRAYTHNAEGPDDMPAHLRAALTQTSLGIPILDGALGLGTWQGIFLWEHRRRGAQRQVIVQVLGT